MKKLITYTAKRVFLNIMFFTLIILGISVTNEGNAQNDAQGPNTQVITLTTKPYKVNMDAYFLNGNVLIDWNTTNGADNKTTRRALVSDGKAAYVSIEVSKDNFNFNEVSVFKNENQPIKNNQQWFMDTQVGGLTYFRINYLDENKIWLNSVSLPVYLPTPDDFSNQQNTASY